MNIAKVAHVLVARLCLGLRMNFIRPLENSS